jgi:Replication-relaxation
MQSPKRRSRMRRVCSGKRIELTDRDIALFQLLSRYHYLRSNFLYAFLGGNSETWFKGRLGDLYHDGRYINRPEQQWQFANSRHMPVIYELDAKGEQVLREHGLWHDVSPLLKNGRMGAYRQFAHQLMICDFMASIDLGVRDEPSLRFISWRDIIAKAPEQTRRADNPFEIPVSITHAFPGTGQAHSADIRIVPDGLFGLEYAHEGEMSYRFFALEADRGTMPIVRSNLHQTSYLKKMLAYRQIAILNLQRTFLGLPNLFVLNVTTNEQREENMLSLLNGLTAGQGSKLFLFKTLSTLGDFREAPAPTSHILTAPWSRAGCGDFYINKV